MDGSDVITVLVVDDTAANRHAMSALLRRAGHDVVVTGTADGALRELGRRLRAGALPDVALVDIRLPDMSGYELCRRIKADPALSGIPVVHFSAVAMESGDRCLGLDSGAEAYLTVPAEPEEVQAVIRAALRGARSRNDAEAQAGLLALLASATVAVQSAQNLQQLLDTAAFGAARLTRGPAAVFVTGDDGEVHCGLPKGGSSERGSSKAGSSERGAPERGSSEHGLPKGCGAPPDESARQAVGRVLRGLTADDRDGAGSVVVPAPLWPPGFFPGAAEAGARLFLARSRADRPPVCLAVPVPAPDDREAETAAVLGQLAHATTLAVDSLLMHAEERHLALTLQHSFLPQRLPEVRGVEFAVRYVPASRQAEIGGDFYAALRTDDGRVLFGIGDVVGHSLEAATVMVELRHALRAYFVDEEDPAALLTRLDRMLQRYHPEVTATVCLALVDLTDGRTLIANGGHMPPLLIPEHGEPAYTEVRGPLLGVGLAQPPATEIRQAPGDRMLLFTDGLIETRHVDLSLSMEHLRSAAADAPPGVGPLCDALLECFGTEREDDIALLALRMSR